MILTVFVSCAAVDIDSVHVAAVRIPAKQGPWEYVANENVGPADLVRIYLGQSWSAVNGGRSSRRKFGRAALPGQEKDSRHGERILPKTVPHAGWMSKTQRTAQTWLMGVSSSRHPHQRHSNGLVAIPIATVAGNWKLHPLTLPFAPVDCLLLSTMLVAGGYAIQQDQQKILGRIVHVVPCYSCLGVPDKYLGYYPTLTRRYLGPCGLDQ